MERWGWLPLLAGVAAATRARPGGRRGHGAQVAQRPAGDGRAARSARPAASSPSAPARRRRSSSASASTSRCAPTNCPYPTAGSLALAGAAATDRDPLLRAVLRSLEEWYGRVARRRRRPGRAAGCRRRTRRAARRSAAPCGPSCPAADELTGEAVAIDGDGRLVHRPRRRACSSRSARATSCICGGTATRARDRCRAPSGSSEAGAPVSRAEPVVRADRRSRRGRFSTVLPYRWHAAEGMRSTASR